MPRVAVSSLLPCFSLLLAAAAAAACSRSAPAPASAAAPDAGPWIYRGMCDASAGVPLAGELFAVADDEDNRLRVYSRAAPGEAVAIVDLGAFLELEAKSPEIDFEAATRAGDRIYWLGSHGRSKGGKPRPNRLRLVATSVDAAGALAPVGRPYTGLIDDLLDEPRLAAYDLRAAEARAPKEVGGLNIEGLATMPDGSLLIGFRNPIPGGRALLVPLLNAAALVDGSEARARFGEPLALDLGGLGVRGLERSGAGYVIVAGDFGEQRGTGKLFAWDGAAAPVPLAIDLGTLNPEGLVVFPDRDRWLVLSDDGSVSIGGRACKELPDTAARRFRAAWVDPL